jgi:hypothetical protein
MISPGIVEIPERVHGWLLEQTDTAESAIYNLFPTVEEDESFPDPLAVEDVDGVFPCLGVVFNGWDQIESEHHEACAEVGTQVKCRLILTRVLGKDDIPGKTLRALQAALVALFIQGRYHRPPAGLWRPEDISDTGIALFRLTATAARPQDPLPYDDGILIEQAEVLITAQGTARSE